MATCDVQFLRLSPSFELAHKFSQVLEVLLAVTAKVATVTREVALVVARELAAWTGMAVVRAVRAVAAEPQHTHHGKAVHLVDEEHRVRMRLEMGHQVVVLLRGHVEVLKQDGTRLAA